MPIFCPAVSHSTLLSISSKNAIRCYHIRYIFFRLKYVGQIQIVNFFSPPHACKKVVVYGKQIATIVLFSGQSSLSIFAQKYLRKCKDIYIILQNKYLCIYEDNLGAKILADYCALNFIEN